MECRSTCQGIHLKYALKYWFSFKFIIFQKIDFVPFGLTTYISKTQMERFTIER